MEISIMLAYPKKTPDEIPRTLEEAAKICKEGGVSYVDYLSNVKVDNWEELAHQEAKIIADAGLKVHQSHAPFNRYNKEDEELFRTYLLRSVDATKILGGKYLVIHGDEFNTFDRETDDALAWSTDYFRPVVEYGKKQGIEIAFENVFEDYFENRLRYTSLTEDLNALVDSLDAVVCWDYGHGRAQYPQGEDLPAIKRVGKRLACTHVHDGYYGGDLHVPPFFGWIDWKAHMQFLKEIDYQGMLTHEPVYGQMPDELVVDYVKFMVKIGEVLNLYKDRA